MPRKSSTDSQLEAFEDARDRGHYGAKPSGTDNSSYTLLKKRPRAAAATKAKTKAEAEPTTEPAETT